MSTSLIQSRSNVPAAEMQRVNVVSAAALIIFGAADFFFTPAFFGVFLSMSK